MRLAFVNSAWAASWGGGEKWTIEAADWFRGHGHEVIVVGRPASKVIAAARSLKIEVEEFPFGGDWNPFAIWGARRILKKYSTDLVVVNFNKEAWQFGRAAKKLGIPIIARHGFPLLRKNIHHRLLLEKIITRLVVNARTISRDYSALGFDMLRTRVIHNGVRIVPQRRGELRKRFNIPPDALLVLAAGRIESQKRFDRVVEIASEVLPDFPETRFLIAGAGPDQPTLEQKIHAHGLAADVRFAGFIPDLAELIGDADLFLLTSDQEGTPNVLLEAMAAGVPCVAFAVGSVPEIFAGALASSALTPGAVDVMTKTVRELLANSAQRSTLSALLRLRVQTEFSLDHSMKQFEQLFEETLSNRR